MLHEIEVAGPVLCFDTSKQYMNFVNLTKALLVKVCIILYIKKYEFLNMF